MRDGPHLSSRARAVQPSATLATAARARALRAAGVDVVTFATGEPDLPTPEAIREAAKAALDRGETHYAPLRGLPELREAICARLQSDRGLTFDPDAVLVGVGAKQVLYNACQALLDPGDEAVLITPCWVSYPDMVRLAGARPVFVATRPEDRFEPDPKAIEGAITERTRLLFLNAPSNPTGAVIPRATLEAIAETLRRHPAVTVLSDDIYARIRYDDAEVPHLLEVAPDLRGRVLVVDGVSKSYAMTGWRIGWAAGPKALVDAMARIQGQSTSGATTFAQFGALAALTGDQGPVEEMRATFERRRALLCDGLDALPGVRCSRPAGAFYAFPDLREVLGRRVEGHSIASSVDLCERLLELEHLACVPGTPFGAEGFLRLSFAASEETLQEGLARLRRFLARLE